MLSMIKPMGFNVTQVYGLTELYGPAIECTWGLHFDHLEGDARAAIKARQSAAIGFADIFIDSGIGHGPRGCPATPPKTP